MFERFTDNARKIMALADQEAQRFNHEYIGTEHILLGMVKGGSGVATNALKFFGVDLRKVRLEVEKLVLAMPEKVATSELPQTPRAKKVIEYAILEAKHLDHNYVGTEHLLLGLLREQDGVAGQVLVNLGLRLERVREEVCCLLGADPAVTDATAQDATEASEFDLENQPPEFRGLYDQLRGVVSKLQASLPQISAKALEHDPEVCRAFKDEYERQSNTIELIASENHVSSAVLAAMGSIFTNKYAEGYPGRRYYGGCANMDAVENLARERAKELFDCEHVNVQPHSGTQANTAVYLGFLEPGDTILSLDLAHGGHLSHGMRINITGLLYNIVHYGVDKETETFDMAEVRRLAREHKPKLIITGASAYPRTIDFAAFTEIAREVGALHMADIAHIAGLVAADLHPDPVPVADFVTTTTHKTLRGPRGGMIMCKGDYAKKIDSRVFPGIQGGPLMHVIAAKAVAFGEALKPSFNEYQQQIIDNAKALCEGLKSAGIRMVSGGTDSHLMLVDLRPSHPDVTGKAAEDWLEQAHIITNKNMIPFDERKPMETSGLRIGTPAVTTRGMKQSEMQRISSWISEVLASNGSPAVIKQVKGAVLEMCQQFPLP